MIETYIKYFISTIFGAFIIVICIVITTILWVWFAEAVERFWKDKYGLK